MDNRPVSAFTFESLHNPAVRRVAQELHDQDRRIVVRADDLSEVYRHEVEAYLIFNGVIYDQVVMGK